MLCTDPLPDEGCARRALVPRPHFLELAFLQRHRSDLNRHHPSFVTEAENERGIVQLTSGAQSRRNR